MTFKTRKSTKRPYHRVVFGGNPSVGKTTGATRWCKNPLWIDLDDRIPDDVGQQDVVEDILHYNSLITKLREIKDSDEFTWDGLVIDTFTIAEMMSKDHCIEVDFSGNIDNYSSFSTGDKHNLPQHVNQILSLLDQIARKHWCDIVLICHSDIKPEKNPNGDNYDKVKLDLTAKVRQRVLQWADLVSFAWDDVTVVTEGIGKKVQEDTTRKISFHNDPRFDAKGDAKIPKEIVFDKDGDWADTVKAIIKTPKEEVEKLKKTKETTKPRRTQL